LRLACKFSTALRSCRTVPRPRCPFSRHRLETCTSKYTSMCEYGASQCADIEVGHHGAVCAGVDAEGGFGGHSRPLSMVREKREEREIVPAISRHERVGKREEREEDPFGSSRTSRTIRWSVWARCFRCQGSHMKRLPSLSLATRRSALMASRTALLKALRCRSASFFRSSSGSACSAMRE
jgi:hypothetical protein